MTWLAEVRHVLAKDVRQFRWMVAVYLAFVLAAMVRSAGWAALDVLGSGLAPIAVVLSGMIIIASTVQTDSPIRENAFWATHPLRPSVMAGAKVGFAMLLVAMGLVAQAVALGAYDLGGADTAFLLVATASATMSWLIVAMVIGAITRELPSFLLTVIALPVLGYTLVMVFMQLLPPQGSQTIVLPDSAGAGWRWLALLGGIGIVAWLYRWRDGRRRTRAMAVVVAALALYTATLPFPDDDDALPSVPEDLSLALEVDEDGTRGSEMQLRVTGPVASSAVARRFEPREFTIRLRNDSTLRLDPSMLAVFGGNFSVPPVPPIPGVRWIDHPAESVISHSMLLRLPYDGAPVRVDDITTVSIAGRMILSEPRTLARMPLRVGAEVVNDGYRIRVDRWTPTVPELPLAIAVSVVHVAAMRPVPGSLQEQALSAAIINERRGEGFVLQQRGTGSGSDGLVLPGVPARALELRYDRSSGARPSSLPDADWLRDAELLIFREVPVGAYPMRLEHTPR